MCIFRKDKRIYKILACLLACYSNKICSNNIYLSNLELKLVCLFFISTQKTDLNQPPRIRKPALTHLKCSGWSGNDGRYWLLEWLLICQAMVHV